MPSNRYYAGPVTDHFDGLRFFNPDHPTTDRGVGDLLRWRFGERRARWPAQVPVTPARPPARSIAPRVTIVGHASALIQIAGLNILTDPVWSHRASPVAWAGPARVAAPGIAFDDLPPVDAVLLSHNHYDHLDVATLRRLDARDRPRLVTPLGNDAIIARHIPSMAVTTGDWSDRIALSPEVSVAIVPAQHWSSRSISDRRMALWSGFWIEGAGRSVYFAGDTGYGSGAIFRGMRDRLGSPDIALLPIGAYAPRWFMAAQHADPDDAVRIFRDLDARRAVGIHWGVFQLTDEGWDAPREGLAAALARQGVDRALFHAGLPGDVVEAG